MEARDLHKIKVCRRDFISAEGLWICGTSDSFESEKLKIDPPNQKGSGQNSKFGKFLPIRVEVMFSHQNVCKTGRRVVWKQEIYIK